ncbi:VOC family protein, partial [Paraburkholderia sp. RL18-085-BIA-A]|uniref:VOC family protein n=1 Tax=Paraburkholderia sp. RL18-085-BIA-A TaxID=3031633 RepID=UPI0038B8A77B
MSLENWNWGKDGSHIDLATVRPLVEQRHAGNRVRMLHHNAYRCRSAEETRHFYEDILEMPLVAALFEPLNAVTHEPDPYVHLYFELADGSCLAFFDYPGLFRRENTTFDENNPYMQHIALQVDGEEQIEYYKERLSRHDVEYFELDHGYCHSIYFSDPNGMRVEFTSNVAVTEQFFADAAHTAHDDLKRWMELRA